MLNWMANKAAELAFDFGVGKPLSAADHSEIGRRWINLVSGLPQEEREAYVLGVGQIVSDAVSYIVEKNPGTMGQFARFEFAIRNSNKITLNELIGFLARYAESGVIQGEVYLVVTAPLMWARRKNGGAEEASIQPLIDLCDGCLQRHRELENELKNLAVEEDEEIDRLAATITSLAQRRHSRQFADAYLNGNFDGLTDEGRRMNMVEERLAEAMADLREATNSNDIALLAKLLAKVEAEEQGPGRAIPWFSR